MAYERTVHFTVTENAVNPCDPQYAGVQGDNNSTLISFDLSEKLASENYKYRVEFTDGMGAFLTSDFLSLTGTEVKMVNVPIPREWTQAGGAGEVRLVISELDALNNELHTVFSAVGRVYFSSRSSGTDSDMRVLYHGLSSLVADMHNAVDETKQATEDANEAADAANEAAGSVNEALSNTAEAIDGANAARDAANLAAQEAKEAAVAAEEEAEAAHQIALAAQAAAGKADTAATAAQNAASEAQSAASAANTAAGTANTAAGTANAAASAANTAAEAANEAADAANEAAESIADKVDTVDALPVHTMERQSGPDSWKPTPGIAVPDTGPYTGMAIRAVWEEEWDASVPIWCFGGIYSMQASGHHPAGTYILTFTSSYDWTVQPLDMAYTDERAEQAADKAAEAHAAQVRRTYQPAWKRTAGGCPLSVADAAEGADLSGLVLKGRTMVSGTPSPDAPVTITGVKPQTVAVTGKNLIPPKAASETINGVTCTVNADGSLTLNGTATATTFFNFPYTKIIPGIYTLSAGVRLAANVNLILRKRTPEKQLIYVYSGSDSNAKTKLIGYSGEVRVYVEVRSGTTVSNLTIYPQLEAGSEATAYEPYQGETITSDEVELYGDAQTVGKNLIPTMDEPLSANGITCTVNVDGSITLNGTATANAYFYFPDIMIMSSGTYTLSTSANLAGGTFYVLRIRSNNVWLINIQAGSKSKSEAISYSGAAQAYIAVASGTTLSNLTIYPQLELGSKATAYEPYQGMTTALEDGDSLDLATGEVVRRWKRLELDGTEKWTIQSVNEYGITNFNTVLSDGGDFAKGCICTHYVTQYTVIANTHDRGIFISNTHSLFIRETAYTTVEEFKTWLAAQKEAGTPVTVLYRLKKPEVVSGGAHSLAQPEGEMAISALGTRGETAEAVDTEALYTYRPNWDDILSRLAALENLISQGGEVGSVELAAHNASENAHTNLVIDGNTH
jgi:hypothetical protein